MKDFFYLMGRGMSQLFGALVGVMTFDKIFDRRRK